MKVLKDPLPHDSRPNVVYKINCKNCEASYMGQTGRMLKPRFKKHKQHINRNTTQHSVITKHRLLLSHDFDYDNVEILNIEPSYHKRLISETIHIKNQKSGLNLQNDTESFDKAYFPIIS